MISDQHKIYLKKLQREKIFVSVMQIMILVILILLWEYLSYNNIINSFIYSSPSKIIKTIISLYNQHNLFNHIWVTIYESVISFALATLIGTLIAMILWYSRLLYRIVEPYLTILNSLPKVALGPIIIILFGANVYSIIVMSLLISLIVTISSVYSGFVDTDKNMIKLMLSFNASKWQILKFLIIPYNYSVIISSLKINVGLSLVGVIMGEFLVSKSGIGYLINYGSQVFNLNLVFAGIVILLIVSYLMYLFVLGIEKVLVNGN